MNFISRNIPESCEVLSSAVGTARSTGSAPTLRSQSSLRPRVGQFTGQWSELMSSSVHSLIHSFIRASMPTPYCRNEIFVLRETGFSGMRLMIHKLAAN